MTLTEILHSRRSVRRFEDRVVPREVIERILALALTAPSSKNARSTRFMVVSDRAVLQKIALMRDFGSSFLADVPCAVLVLGDASATDLWVDNAAIAATIVQIAAVDAGLGSCWVHINGRPQKRDNPDGPTATDYVREFLPIPDGCNPLCFIALGYPATAPKPHTSVPEDKITWLS